MEFLRDLGPFVLAVVAVIINGVPQLLYAQARGFALKPAGFAYLTGGFGNLLTGSVTPISSGGNHHSGQCQEEFKGQCKFYTSCGAVDDHYRCFWRDQQNF